MINLRDCSIKRAPEEKTTTRCGRFLLQEVKTNQRENAPTAVAYFKSRWGEVDGYLPVLKKFKDTHPDWRIIALIGSERLANTIAEQPLLYNELKHHVDALIHLAPQRPRSTKDIFYRKWIRKLASWYHRKCVPMSWYQVLEYLKSKNIKLIIKDHGNDDQFLIKLQSMFSAKCVSAPHGTGIFIEATELDVRKKQQIKIDLFLVGDETEIPCFQQFLGNAKSVNMQVVGRPRYDQWWIEYLSKLPCLALSDEYELSNKSQRVFLFATRGPSSSFFPESVFKYLVESVAETVLSQPGNLLLIKPHPQQDLAFIKSTMAKYDSNCWRISSLQTMQLAHISDFVICMVSSVILDALAVGKPTVEYFQYVKGHQYFQQNESGKTISAYTKLGLVVPAETKEELKVLIDDYFSSDNRSDRWEKQREQTVKFMKLDDNASQRVITEIDKVLRLQ